MPRTTWTPPYFTPLWREETGFLDQAAEAGIPL